MNRWKFSLCKNLMIQGILNMQSTVSLPNFGIFKQSLKTTKTLYQPWLLAIKIDQVHMIMISLIMMTSLPFISTLMHCKQKILKLHFSEKATSCIMCDYLERDSQCMNASINIEQSAPFLFLFYFPPGVLQALRRSCVMCFVQGQ